jgi:hypothetical protein
MIYMLAALQRIAAARRDGLLPELAARFERAAQNG